MLFYFALLCFVFFLRRYLFVLFFSPLMYVYSKLARKKHDLTKSNIDVSPRSETTQSKNLGTTIRRYYSGLYRFYIRILGQTASMSFRIFIYQYILLVRMGKGVVIYHNADFRAPYNIVIGEGSIIGDNAVLDGRNGIIIGSNVNFSSNVSIWTEQHDHRDPYFRCETQIKHPTIIGDRAWIGPNTILLPNVEIGEGSVIAAGAVATTKLESFGIFAGIPAKKIGERNRDLKYVFTGEFLPLN